MSDAQGNYLAANAERIRRKYATDDSSQTPERPKSVQNIDALIAKWTVDNLSYADDIEAIPAVFVTNAVLLPAAHLRSCFGKNVNEAQIPGFTFALTEDRTQNPILQPNRIAWDHLNRRISDIKSIAQDEGIKINAESEKDLMLFLTRHPFSRRPYLSLLDNGNYRALWKNSEGEQIGLQFLGDEIVQFVFFMCRNKKESSVVMSSCGKDTVADIFKQITANGLGKLLQA